MAVLARVWLCVCVWGGGVLDLEWSHHWSLALLSVLDLGVPFLSSMSIPRPKESSKKRKQWSEEKHGKGLRVPI